MLCGCHYITYQCVCMCVYYSFQKSATSSYFSFSFSEFLCMTFSSSETKALHPHTVYGLRLQIFIKSLKRSQNFQTTPLIIVPVLLEKCCDHSHLSVSICQKETLCASTLHLWAMQRYVNDSSSELESE